MNLQVPLITKPPPTPATTLAVKTESFDAFTKIPRIVAQWYSTTDHQCIAVTDEEGFWCYNISLNWDDGVISNAIIEEIRSLKDEQGYTLPVTVTRRTTTNGQ